MTCPRCEYFGVSIPLYHSHRKYKHRLALVSESERGLCSRSEWYSSIGPPRRKCLRKTWNLSKKGFYWSLIRVARGVQLAFSRDIQQIHPSHDIYTEVYQVYVYLSDAHLLRGLLIRDVSGQTHSGFITWAARSILVAVSFSFFFFGRKESVRYGSLCFRAPSFAA